MDETGFGGSTAAGVGAGVATATTGAVGFDSTFAAGAGSGAAVVDVSAFAATGADSVGVGASEDCSGKSPEWSGKSAGTLKVVSAFFPMITSDGTGLGAAGATGAGFFVAAFTGSGNGTAGISTGHGASARVFVVRTPFSPRNTVTTGMCAFLCD